MSNKRKATNTKQKQLNKAYSKARSKAKATYNRLLKQGYIFDFSLPSIPKKVTEASIRNISKYTPAYLRSKAEYVTDTGKIISGTAGFNVRREQAGKKAYQTKVERAELGYKTFAEQFVRVPNKKHFEESVQEYYPDQASIIINTFTEQHASSVLPMDLYRELREMAKNAPTDDITSWYARSAKARWASTVALEILDRYLTGALRNRFLNKNKIALNIINSGEKDTLMAALDRVMYGYNETEINAGLNTIITMLTGKAIAANDAKALAEEDEEYSDVE